MKGNTAALILLFVFAPAYGQTPNTLTPRETAEGWRLLFDGATFEGWRGYRLAGLPEAGWELEDGLLKTVPKVRGRELITVAKFEDFELSWEWKVEPSGNSGVKYFVTEDRPAAPGHEYQMIDDAAHPDGRAGAQRTTGAFYDVLPPAADKPLKKGGE